MFVRTRFQRVLSRQGQSLIEVTFAAAVVGLVLVAVLSLVIASLRQARISLEQSQATQSGQVVIEWLRAQRNQEGWGSFSSSLAAQGSNPLVACVPVLPDDFSTWLSGSLGPCDRVQDRVPGTEMTREVEISLQGTPVNAVFVNVILTRPGSDGLIENRLQTEFSPWE